MLQEWSADSNYVHKMVVKGEWLLVLVCLAAFMVKMFAEDEEIDTTQAGINVLNQSDLVEESLFHGNFRCMTGFENCEYAVASDETQGINIFSIEDGRLVHSRSFATQCPGRRLLVSASLVYILACTFHLKSVALIDVFDINRGERVRCLQSPTSASFFPRALASNDREDFCSLYITQYDGSMSSIKAFLV
jgi:hypothetical protein